MEFDQFLTSVPARYADFAQTVKDEVTRDVSKQEGQALDNYDEAVQSSVAESTRNHGTDGGGVMPASIFGTLLEKIQTRIMEVVKQRMNAEAAAESNTTQSTVDEIAELERSLQQLNVDATHSNSDSKHDEDDTRDEQSVASSASSSDTVRIFASALPDVDAPNPHLDAELLSQLQQEQQEQEEQEEQEDEDEGDSEDDDDDGVEVSESDVIDNDSNNNNHHGDANEPASVQQLRQFMQLYMNKHTAAIQQVGGLFAATILRMLDMGPGAQGRHEPRA